jgi:protein TonB
VTEIDVVSSPDSSLTASAIDAVKQWTYQPYLFKGSPVEVDTTITVNYNLNR